MKWFKLLIPVFSMLFVFFMLLYVIPQEEEQAALQTASFGLNNESFVVLDTKEETACKIEELEYKLDELLQLIRNSDVYNPKAIECLDDGL